MNSDTIALVVGTLLALAALSFVLVPLLKSSDPTENSRATRKPSRKQSVADEDGLAVSALREIEFDRETGKLSDFDYEELKHKYTALALAELRALDDEGATRATPMSVAVDPNEDPVEAAVRAAQAQRPHCDGCGPRPESDAIYCSSCGSYLPGRCGACGEPIAQSGARFCSGCGDQLAAA